MRYALIGMLPLVCEREISVRSQHAFSETPAVLLFAPAIAYTSINIALRPHPGHREVIAVEMEAYAVMAAAYFCGATPLVTRAIPAALG
ncbi:hypothetical protein [Rhodanobacter glycinis]|uniref:hypothetical protein n=1 Tax=Rhodanobacter glycinis TaxID=582702 RepID=UPI001126E735|nr:hypothetical protein [Rhodanobacter glycinis]